jgi:hypothetical protein
MMARLRGSKGNDGDNHAANVSGQAEIQTDIMAAIVAYLRTHPGAADNATGIQRWWLPAKLANVSSTEVAASLAALVGEGRLETQRLPGGHVIFSGVSKPDPRH